jgi:hypothetical protein
MTLQSLGAFEFLDGSAHCLGDEAASFAGTDDAMAKKG